MTVRGRNLSIIKRKLVFYNIDYFNSLKKVLVGPVHYMVQTPNPGIIIEKLAYFCKFMSSNQ